MYWTEYRLQVGLYWRLCQWWRADAAAATVRNEHFYNLFFQVTNKVTVRIKDDVVIWPRCSERMDVVRVIRELYLVEKDGKSQEVEGKCKRCSRWKRWQYGSLKKTFQKLKHLTFFSRKNTFQLCVLFIYIKSFKRSRRSTVIVSLFIYVFFYWKKEADIYKGTLLNRRHEQRQTTHKFRGVWSHTACWLEYWFHLAGNMVSSQRWPVDVRWLCYQ